MHSSKRHACTFFVFGKNDVLAKEQAKALAMRQRFEERTKRFLDAKQRTIGVDKEYLWKQVEEKNIELLKKNEEGKNDAIHLEQLCKYLDEREMAQQEDKRKELEDVHATLNHQVHQPKNNAIDKGEPLDLENCGPSSIQRFQGEDRDCNSRKIKQQQQLQVWCAQKKQEKQDEINQEVEKENEYSQYVIEEDELRCELYNQEKAHRSEIEASIMMENLKLSEERRIKEQEEKEREKELEAAENMFVGTSPFFCEETDYAKSMLSESRVRPDHFKGFSPKESKAIIEANISVAAEKDLLIKTEQQREQEWALHQAYIISRMEQMEETRNKSIEEDNNIQAETIMAQREELKEKQKAMEREKFGEIRNGFFQKFGTSCR